MQNASTEGFKMIYFLFKNSKIRGSIAVFLAKFWMTLASIGIAINLIIVLALVQMAPKLKMIAQVLPSSETAINTSSHIQVDTLPVKGLLSSTSDINKSNRSLIDEMLVRYYIDARLSLFADENEMGARWQMGGTIHRLSAPKVYKEFAKDLKEKLRGIKHLKATTSVYITSLTSLGNTYTAEVDVYVYNPFEPNEKPKVQHRVITIQVAHRNNVHRYNKVESNPYGFYVAVYKERKKG